MGKKIRRAIGALMMAVAIAITQIPVSDVEAVDTASVSDFQINGNTLVKYNGTSADVSIGGSVEYIAEEAFAGNEFIKRISLGDNIKSIGAEAFEGCINLQSVNIPNSVETIEQAAFASCPSLSEVKIGTGLKSLGNGVFAGDTSLQSVAISSSNPYLTCDDGAIYSKDKETLYAVLAGRLARSYEMPSTVSTISPYAFWGYRNLENVSISGNVSEISAYAFSYCSNLKFVNIPYSIRRIGLKAFENCIRLRKITIPVSVNSIHKTAFDGCTKLTIDAPEGSTAKTFANSLVLGEVDVSEYEDTEIDTINDGNIVSDSQETGSNVKIDNYYNEVTHMSPLEENDDAAVKGKSKVIGSQAFVFVDNASATVNSGAAMSNTVEGVAYGETGETIASISGSSDAKGGSFPKYTIVDDSIIADQAYYNDKRTEITIPDTITEIGEFAFARSGINSMSIPEGVEKIGYAAFYHCDSLTNVVIPNSVKEISPAAFDKTPWLQNWEQSGSSDFLIVGDGILLAYRGSASVVNIPDTVKTIGADAFSAHSEITGVIIPDSVEIIGEGAFSNCSALTEIEGGNSVKQIRDRAFAGCPISNIRIPASVEEIGLRAFDVADSVKNSNTGVVVFEGASIPKISYETSSGKIYNDSYRGLAFSGINSAVVPEGAGEFENTVLDGKLYGFRGEVVTAGGNSKASVTGYGSGISADMNSDALTDNGNANISETGSNTSANGVVVNINSDTIEDNGSAYALLDGAEGSYILSISDNDAAKSAILNAYRKLYGNNTPANLQAYDISLEEADKAIPITGLGKQKIEITIPAPSGITENNFHVVSLDNNGQLEEVESRFASVDGMDCLVFTTNHFSPYGIYNYASGNSAAVENGQAVFTSISGNKDASPNTGDNSIHPKWFLVIGLLFTGLALILYRGKRHNIIV
ncbi:MAG: leucine-rich repeat protein [Lachnospiraceae bacterium]|nr:leucine-rich repeat protein [Lachnospiraceae bacterium]